MVVRQIMEKNGFALSRLITGVWRWAELSVKDTEKLIHASLEAAITSFDHADIYGGYQCEELFGKAFPASLRTDVQLITKCGIKLVHPSKSQHRIKHYDTSKAHIMASVEQSLKNLRTDYIDLLLIHRPDPLIQPAEVASAFETLHTSGKVRHFGVSNFLPAQVEMILQYVPDLITNQIELSLATSTKFMDGTLDFHLARGLHPMAWSPLGGGGLLRADHPSHSTIKALSEQYACSPEQLLLAWLMKHPAGILPVLGTTQPERITRAAHAAGLHIDRQDWFDLLRASAGKEVP
jgi:predicted oxidoreductase